MMCNSNPSRPFESVSPDFFTVAGKSFLLSHNGTPRFRKNLLKKVMVADVVVSDPHMATTGHLESLSVYTRKYTPY